MAKRERLIQETMLGLEVRVTLNEWEQTLLKGLRAKAKDGLRLGPAPEPWRRAQGGEKP
jgi:hypothetical protein